MKGTLHKTESGWQVWYHAKEDLFYGNTGVRILPLHPDDTIGIGQENLDIEFEIFDNREICNCACHKNPDITHFVACCNNGYKTDNLGHVHYYAKLIDQRPTTMKGGEGWDKILDKAIQDKATRPPTEDDAWPEYPSKLHQLQIHAAEECFRKYPNNEELYTTDELKDAYKAGVIDGLKEWTLDSYDRPKYPEVKIICPRCKVIMPCACNANWDTIWKDFRDNKNASYSWSLLEYLKNNYNPPTKKQRDE